jgi:hydrogenase maturation factor HypF (carbamoyltransferase family)
MKLCSKCSKKYPEPKEKSFSLGKCDECGEITGLIEVTEFSSYDMPDFMKDIFNFKK